MVDHHVGGKIGQQCFDFGQRHPAPGIHHMQLHVPAAACDATGHQRHFRDGNGTRVTDVVAHASHAGFVHAIQLSIGSIGPQCRYHPGGTPELGDGIHVPAVVGAVSAGLHQHHPINIQGIKHILERRGQRIRHVKSAR